MAEDVWGEPGNPGKLALHVFGPGESSVALLCRVVLSGGDHRHVTMLCQTPNRADPSPQTAVPTPCQFGVPLTMTMTQT